ncbi:MAG: hypothetical protein U0324_01285 [Polyangiales bacterium]
MGPTVMALMISAPTQLAAVAGVELSGGYDSTVANFTLSPPQWGDGPILRTAVDIQVGHRTETLQQTLRARGEMYYAGGDGRSIDNANFTALTRYNLRWVPDDDWRFEVNGGYNVGAAAMLVQGGAATRGTPFQYGTYGEYLALAQITRTFRDRYRIQPFGGVNGRHTIDVPPGTPRGDMISYRAGISSTADVGDTNTFGAAVNGERLGMAGLGDWIHRVTVFGLWRHAWTDTFGTGISAGADLIQDQTDPLRERWNAGPYGNLVITKVVPEARLAFTLAGRYEFTTVNSVACGGALLANGTCPPDQVIAGGVGRVGGGTFQFAWRPLEDGRLTLVGITTADYGVTENHVRSGGRVLPETHAVGNMNFTASLNARWVLARTISAFARYTFLFQHVEEPATLQDVRRHLLLAGITISFTAGEADYLDGVIPWQEAEVTNAIRGAAASAPSADAVAAENAASGEEPGVLDDPLDPADRPAPPPPRRQGDPEPELYPVGDPRRAAPAPTGAAPTGSNNPQQSPSAPARPREGTEGPNG